MALPPALPVIWTASVSRLSGLLADVALEFADRARFVAIDLAFEQAWQVIDQRLASEPCDVIVAGGANAAFLRGRVQVPLITVQASGFDLLAALARARRIHPRVGLVTHAGDLPDVSPFAEAFALGLAHRQFQTREEARDCIADLKANGIGVVVGTGLAIDFAEAAGLPGVLLYSAEAVRHSYEQALLLAQTHAQPVPQHARSRLRRPLPRQALLGRSAAMEQLRQRIALYAPQPLPVAIDGPPGSGRGLVAQQLHQASGRNGRLQVLQCAGLDAASLEQEIGLEGPERRPALLDAALGGSLLLDNLDELAMPLQGRLLRLLDGIVHLRGGPLGSDIRVLSSSTQPLAQLHAQGRLRSDLYHRLAGLHLPLPALAQREDDAALLLDHWLAVGGPVVPLSASARQWLLAQDWPGNVRQLRSQAERIALHWRQRPLGAVEPAHLQQWLPELGPAGPVRAAADSPARPDAGNLQHHWHRLGGDRQLLMRHYGVSRTTLWRWLRAAGLG